MKYIKSFIITALCFCASKFAYAQNVSKSMYVQSDSLLNIYAKDTLYASLGPFGERALILTSKNEKPALVLSKCYNHSTPQKISLVRIGKELYKIDGNIIVKLKDSILKQALQYNHCDHCSHYSHRSHFSGK